MNPLGATKALLVLHTTIATPVRQSRHLLCAHILTSSNFNCPHLLCDVLSLTLFMFHRTRAHVSQPRRTGARKDTDDVGVVVTASALFSQTGGVYGGNNIVHHLAAVCPGESVVCKNGFVAGTFGTNDNCTCAEGCNSKCCVGNLECKRFIGKVCANKISCVGIRACLRATIDLVVAGCGGG